jgi:hypothetical protein
MRKLLLLLAFFFASGSGCAWLKDQVAGEDFQSWNSSLGTGMRGDPQKSQPSGFFLDRRAQSIEKSLGGGY